MAVPQYRLFFDTSVYIAGFLVYFMTHPVGLFLLELRPDLYWQLNTGLLACAFVCVAGMGLWMRREGEAASAMVGHSWNPAEMERLVRRLNEYNARLEGNN